MMHGFEFYFLLLICLVFSRSTRLIYIASLDLISSELSAKRAFTDMLDSGSTAGCMDVGFMKLIAA
jgi:hypothetical protein